LKAFNSETSHPAQPESGKTAKDFMGSSLGKRMGGLMLIIVWILTGACAASTISPDSFHFGTNTPEFAY
jgi:ATP/ADP translocase